MSPTYNSPTFDVAFSSPVMGTDHFLRILATFERDCHLIAVLIPSLANRAAREGPD